MDCGSRGNPQIIHVDRMRKKNPQLIGGEIEDSLELTLESQVDFTENKEKQPETQSEYPQEANEALIDNNREVVDNDFVPEEIQEQDDPNEGRRIRRRPVWMRDYYV